MDEDGFTLVTGGGGGGGGKRSAKKFAAKVAKGDVHTYDSMVKCIDNKCVGKASVKLSDKFMAGGRNHCKHDLNIDELRDLMVALVKGSPRQIPKQFHVTNRAFIRNIVLLHISDDDDSDPLVFPDCLKVDRLPPGISSSNSSSSGGGSGGGSSSNSINSKSSSMPILSDNADSSPSQNSGCFSILRVSRTEMEARHIPHRMLSISQDEVESSGLADLASSLSPSSPADDNADIITSSAASGGGGIGGVGVDATSIVEKFVISQSSRDIWAYPKIISRASYELHLQNEQMDTSNSTDTQGKSQISLKAKRPSGAIASSNIDNGGGSAADDNNNNDNDQESSAESSSKRQKSDLDGNPSASSSAPSSDIVIKYTAPKSATLLVASKIYPSIVPSYEVPSTALAEELIGSFNSNKFIVKEECVLCCKQFHLNEFVKTLPREKHAELVERLTSSPLGSGRSSILEELQRSGMKDSIDLSLLAIDCEMCDTEDGLEITRVTVVNRLNSVIFDQLVKPKKPIIEYRTAFSGINEEIMRPVTTTLDQVHLSLLELINESTILIGHSLENDLKALKLCHLRCMDTAVLFPSPRGFPYRLKLKQITEDYLNMSIQRAGACHDSAEDAKAAMQLALAKIEHGPFFGLSAEKKTFFRLPLVTYLSADHAQKKSIAVAASTTSATEASFPPAGLKLSVLFSNKNQSCHGVVSRDCLFGNLCQHNVPVTLKDDFEGDIEKLLFALSGIAGRSEEEREKVASEDACGRSRSPITSSCDGNSDGINKSSKSNKLSVPDFNIISIVVQRSDLKNSNMNVRTFCDRLKNVLHTPSFPNDSIGYSSLLAVSSQTDTAKIVSLQKRRIACSNVMSTCTWSRENELELRERISAFHMAKLYMDVL